jgi:translation initiation factor 2 subunit 3
MAKKKTIQPEVNIGLVGHVDHGKTSLTKALTGKWTDQHSEELKRGITIRLGYADASFYQYEDGSLGVSEKVGKKKGKLVRKISIVDAPGHETLMATMLCGANIMDGALLLIAANEKCPQPQTKEHIMALEVMGIDKVIVVQNKIDLVSQQEAEKNYKQIKKFLNSTHYKNAPVIPISAIHGANMDVLIQTIQEVIPTPKRDPKKDPVMLVARSFDINKPGTEPDKMVGGILGGALREGKFKIGDDIEIRPGRVYQKANQLVTQALKTKITGLMTGGTPADEIIPGGSVAVQTSLDPSIVGGDSLVGSLVGKPETLPPVWQTLKLKVNLLERVVGAKDNLVVKPLAEKEVLMLNVNSAATVGVVTDLRKNVATCSLKLPVCSEVGSKVTISRRLGNRWRLIGFGIIEE